MGISISEQKETNMICGFYGSNRYLSTFYHSPVEYKGIVYQNSEAAYQAQKCKNKNDRKLFYDLTGAEAKRIGKTIETIDVWDKYKTPIMFEIVFQKFLQNISLKNRLLKTNNELIVETNYWHDNYWGNCECEKCKDINGNNMLGCILMDVRYVLREMNE